MESNDAAQLQSTRSPGATPRPARRAARARPRSMRRREHGRSDTSSRRRGPADPVRTSKLRPHPGATCRPWSDRPAWDRLRLVGARTIRPRRVHHDHHDHFLSGATARHSLSDMTPRRIAIVPHTHWDREWYESYQDFRLNLVDMTRHAPPPARVRRQVPVLHVGRPDGRRRRLPRSAARGRTAAACAGGSRPDQHGTVVHPHGRVPLLGRDDHPEPPDGHRPQRRLRWRHGRRLSARHVRAHRPDAADPPRGRVRARGGLARRALCRHQERILVGGSRRFARAGGVSARRLRQWRRAPRRCQGPRAAHRGPRRRSCDRS